MKLGAIKQETVQTWEHAFNAEDEIMFFVNEIDPNMKSIVSSSGDSQSRKLKTFSKLMLMAGVEGLIIAKEWNILSQCSQ